jgi:polysaccharide deacetylase family protein (PEP-CTERM system associated)
VTESASSVVVNAMTVDVEDYFQVSAFDRVVSRDSWSTFESRVCRNTERLLALFDDAGVRATFFILGWVATEYPQLVREIADAGHEIGSHGFGHQLVYDLSPEAFRADIRRARSVLMRLARGPVLGYRAPSFSVTERSLWALDIILEEGHIYDASVFPIRHDRYGIPNSPRHFHRLSRASGSIWECPASTVRLAGTNLPIAGGGYFRLLPYAWTKWGIGRVNSSEIRPVTFYLHPWEIDPGQPRLPASALSRFRHYRNLAKTESRLVQLLRDFKWGALADVLDLQVPDVSPQLTPVFI